MVRRWTVALFLFVAMASARAEKPLSGGELGQFLGPVSPSLLTWEKTIVADVEIYEGSANVPLSGSVIIDISLWTVKPDLGVMPAVGGPDRLGTLHGSWTKGIYNGIHSAAFSFADTDERLIMVDIQSPLESDVETLTREVSRLPMFNSTAATPFHDLMVRKYLARVVDWLLLPSLFLISIWLADRHLRKKRASNLRRALTFAAISAGWIPLFIGLLFALMVLRRWSSTASILHWEFGYSWWLIPAMASVSLIGALLFALWLFVRRKIRTNAALI
jgi:hypothetical protein